MRSSDTAAFDTQTGEITTVTAYSDVPRAQKMKGWFYAFHTGVMGRNDDKGPLFSGRFHRRNLAFERLLSVVEKETFIKEKSL